MCALEGRDEPLPTPGVAPPTLAMVFGVNTGPLQGKEGTHMTGVCLPDGYGWASTVKILLRILLLSDPGGVPRFHPRVHGGVSMKTAPTVDRLDHPMVERGLYAVH